MSKYGERQLALIIKVLDDVARKQPPQHPALPTWDDLQPAVRELLLAMYAAGRRAALEEERNWR